MTKKIFRGGMRHITKMLHKLAELQAASAVYYELNGTSGELFALSFYTEINRPIFEMLSATREVVYRKAMQKWPLDNVQGCPYSTDPSGNPITFDRDAKSLNYIQ